jgi:RNA-directed DNA polymerase
LKQFLKAGFIEKGNLYETVRGVPQGGSISPVIANMTLDGLERAVKQAADGVVKKAKKISRRKTSGWVHTIRYADDFVVTAVSYKMVKGPIKTAVQSFLRERGLTLNEDKTHITSIKQGFNFLGFHFKSYTYGRSRKKIV